MASRTRDAGAGRSEAGPGAVVGAERRGSGAAERDAGAASAAATESAARRDANSEIAASTRTFTAESAERGEHDVRDRTFQHARTGRS